MLALALHQALIAQHGKGSAHVYRAQPQRIANLLLGERQRKLPLGYGTNPVEAQIKLIEKMRQPFMGVAATHVNQSFREHRLLACGHGGNANRQTARMAKKLKQLTVGEGADHPIIDHADAGQPLGKPEVTQTDDIARQVELEDLRRTVAHVAIRADPALLDDAERIHWCPFLPRSEE